MVAGRTQSCTRASTMKSIFPNALLLLHEAADGRLAQVGEALFHQGRDAPSVDHRSLSIITEYGM